MSDHTERMTGRWDVRGRFYRVAGHRVIPCDFAEWSKWFARCSRTVGRREFGGILVSTVCVGIDVDWLQPHAPPAIFETRVFGGKLNEHRLMAATWAEAEENHEEMCRVAFGDRPGETES